MMNIRNNIKRLLANILNLLIVFNIAMLVYCLLFMRSAFSYHWFMYMLVSFQTFIETIAFPVILWSNVIASELHLINNNDMVLVVLCIMLFTDIITSIFFKADVGKSILKIKIESINDEYNILKIIFRYFLKYALIFFLPILLLIQFNGKAGKLFMYEKISKTFIAFKKTN